jgi:DNA-binding SARP family transcriptional activator
MLTVRKGESTHVLDFGVLGPLAVRQGGNPVPVGGMRQRAVLALLLVHANETLSVDRMVGEIWGPSPPATATKILRNSVSQLRSLFDEELVVTHPGGYELRIDPDRVDANRFERLVREGRHALAAGQAELGAAKLREGLALWRGPALADLLDAPFAAAENARLDCARS